MSKTIQSKLKKLASPIGIFLFASTSQIVQAESLISQADNSTVPDVIIDEGNQYPTPSPTDSGSMDNSDPRFTCEFVNSEYIVMYHPESQPGRMYPWAVPGRMADGWTETKRCDAISQRLERYRPDGLLELRTGVENGYNILCVTTEANADCRIVLTVPPGKNPELVRNRVFDNLLVADSGEQTTGVNTLVENSPFSMGLEQVEQILNSDRLNSQEHHSGGINLKPFLDSKDGGTAVHLQNIKPSNSRPSHSPQLNPDLFR